VLTRIEQRLDGGVDIVLEIAFEVEADVVLLEDY
jgi:hypothetical protein